MADAERPAKYRNFPFHSLTDALRVATVIRENKAGKPMRRLLLADALGIKPSSSNFRNLLSSSLKYGLTTGTEKANEISLTDLGVQATDQRTEVRAGALRQAAVTPKVFHDFYTAYDQARLPSAEMLRKILVSDYEVPEATSAECAEMIATNGRWVGIIQNISNSPHVMLDAELQESDQPEDVDVRDEEPVDEEEDIPTVEFPAQRVDAQPTPAAPTRPPAPTRPNAIFIGHGKNKGPLGKLEKILTGFKIPYKVAVAEPNLGRPIPVKVRDTMMECGSAILIFTKDEKFFTEDQKEIWRPSENVVHELGAASFQYEDRVVIFKEKGLDLPTNFSSVGYLEFEEGMIEAKAFELLQELIGLNLVKVTPV